MKKFAACALTWAFALSMAMNAGAATLKKNASKVPFYVEKSGEYIYVSLAEIKGMGLTPEEYAEKYGYILRSPKDDPQETLPAGTEGQETEGVLVVQPEAETTTAAPAVTSAAAAGSTAASTAETTTAAESTSAAETTAAAYATDGPFPGFTEEAEKSFTAQADIAASDHCSVKVYESSPNKVVKESLIKLASGKGKLSEFRFVDADGKLVYSFTFDRPDVTEDRALNLGAAISTIADGTEVKFEDPELNFGYPVSIKVQTAYPAREMYVYDSLDNSYLTKGVTDRNGCLTIATGALMDMKLRITAPGDTARETENWENEKTYTSPVTYDKKIPDAKAPGMKNASDGETYSMPTDIKEPAANYEEDMPELKGYRIKRALAYVATGVMLVLLGILVGVMVTGRT